MTEVGVTAFAHGFDAFHAVAVVGFFEDAFGFGGVVEGRPAAAGVEFFLRGEEFRAAAHAVVGALALLFELVIDRAIGAFGAAHACHFKLFGSEQFFPVIFRLHDFGLGHGFGVGFRFVLGLGDAEDGGKGGEESETEFHGVGFADT